MRLIDADALKDWFQNHVIIGSDGKMRYSGKYIESIIDEQPTVETEPVRHGYWMIRGGDMWCSECGYEDVTEFGEPEDYHYCPNCGARMGGGAENGTD